MTHSENSPARIRPGGGPLIELNGTPRDIVLASGIRCLAYDYIHDITLNLIYLEVDAILSKMSDRGPIDVMGLHLGCLKNNPDWTQIRDEIQAEAYNISDTQWWIEHRESAGKAAISYATSLTIERRRKKKVWPFRPTPRLCNALDGIHGMCAKHLAKWIER